MEKDIPRAKIKTIARALSNPIPRALRISIRKVLAK